jgi:hypothetical protein
MPKLDGLQNGVLKRRAGKPGRETAPLDEPRRLEDLPFTPELLPSCDRRSAYMSARTRLANIF